MSKAGAEGSGGGGGKDHAAGAAVEIQGKPRPPPEEGARAGIEDALEVGIAFEDGAKSRFDHDGEPQVRAMPLEQSEGGGGEDTVAQGAQADDGDSRALRKTL